MSLKVRKVRGVFALGLLVLAGLVAVAVDRVRHLRVRVHDLELLPAGAEVLAADNTIRDTFGSDERVVLALTSRRREVTDPIFLEDVRFFGREIGRSHNLRMLMFDRLTRARFNPAPVAGEPWLLHPPDGP